VTGPKIGRTIADSEPWWPPTPRPRAGSPNVLVVLFDDVGFSDFGCYGSPIATPTIDALAAEGLRYTGFHTTAMCSTTRAALLTGRNHHSVGVGCLANFDSGYPGYRGKIAREAGTIAEMLRGTGYRAYMVGKWHVTSLTETGPTGPFDGWPLGRGFDRFYGFMDAETDQFAPELVRDNTPLGPPGGGFASGYHLTQDLTDQALRFIADHQANAPDRPWLTFLAYAACHAPHQAPQELILKYDALFSGGWDVERERRLARQKALGIVPPATKLPPRNPFVRPWSEHTADEQRLFARLQGAYAAMLEHADQNLARLIGFLNEAGLRDDTLILVLSDNGASQEGGPLGMVNAMGPFNGKPEPIDEKIARIDDIGGPDTHANFPWGWAMAANTPLKRYKQNTHGGGIRDPLVIAWPKGIAARGELRHGFHHVCDIVPTLLDVLELQPPETIGGVRQQPIEGVSFVAGFAGADPPRAAPQYFEMFGHRGLWKDGWKAVAYHPPGMPFDADQWELYHLDEDFSEVDDLAAAHPEKLAELIEAWWTEAERCKVLPLDDRFGPRFAENAARFHGPRRAFVFHAGMGHLPTDVAPDVRSRTFLIEAHVTLKAGDEGVLIAHGDATCGYSLFVQDGRLTYDMNVGGRHAVFVSDRPLPAGAHRLGVAVKSEPGRRIVALSLDGKPAGGGETELGFHNFISWSGLDIGCDRGSPVGDYAAPFAFTGALRKVTVTMDPDQLLDGDAIGEAEMARQ
jgi:arylsulfatase A-like enzyme